MLPVRDKEGRVNSQWVDQYSGSECDFLLAVDCILKEKLLALLL